MTNPDASLAAAASALLLSWIRRVASDDQYAWLDEALGRVGDGDRPLNTAISLSFDVETCQLQPELGKLRLLQLGSAARRTIVVVDFFTLVNSQLQALERIFRNGERFWLAHNAVFDLGWLQEYGLHPRGQVRRR